MVICQGNSMLRYFMKRKDSLIRFLHRIKIQLVRSVHLLALSVRKRLGHVSDLQEMDNSFNTANNTDEMVMSFSEFTEEENDQARIEGAAQPENQIIDGENWDDVDQFPTNDLDIPDVQQLSVQQFSQEIDEETITNSEAPTDPESLYLQSRGTLRFTFKIENISAFCSRYNKVTSDPFKCRNLPFCLIVTHSSNNPPISAYLKRCETGDQNSDNDLDITVACEISVVDQVNGTLLTKSFENHTLRAGHDYGFNGIISISEMKNSGYVHNDSMVFNVVVKAEPPSCHSHFSKTLIGYVGIRNQGATCYMNSLLQVLFFIAKFRTACYRIPTEMDGNSSIALALQKVFYNLQFSDTSVCTKNLTRSFGWSTVDVLMQHDIQEMMRVLIEKIEGRMKNTLLETILPSIFQGKFISYVRCRDVEFSSQREEVFYDIQLSLENANNVYDSFKRYVSPEIMDDDNKYHAGDFGLQAAEKGTLFINLPPVMFLHLLRFQFDATTNQVVKNNNFYQFYDQLDLTEFVREDETTSSKYTLFAVLAHSGGGSHGHYVAYINPALDGSWFKFDDDIISICHPSDAIDSNFGSLNDVDDWVKSMQLNAYMLVYIRNSDAPDILQPVDPMYITDELKLSVSIDPEQEYNNRLRMQHYYNVEINIFLESLLESELTFDHSKCDRPSRMPKFYVTRDITPPDFKKMLQTVFKVSNINQMRIWSIFQHNNYLSYPIFINEDAPLLVPILSQHRRDKSVYHYAVWLELAEPGCELPPFDLEKDVLVFYYYYYSSSDCRPYYIHHGYHDKRSKVHELVPLLNELMNWSSQELNIYQEIDRVDFRELIMSSYLEEYVEHRTSTSVMKVVFESKQHEQITKLNSIALFYQDLAYYVELRIFNDDEENKYVYFNISLSSSFPELLDKLARHLNYDRKKIQIFKCHPNIQRRGEPIPSTATDTLSTLLNCAGHQLIIMFYKRHQIDVIEIESKIVFTFQWLPVDMKKTDMFTIYISNDDTIESILAAAEKELSSRDLKIGCGKVVYIEENRSKILNDSKEILKRLDEVNSYSKRKYFRIEEIPKGDEVLKENEKYVFVESPRYVPRPPVRIFIFKMNWNEPWQTVKSRLRNRLNISEALWEDYQAVIWTKNCEEVDIDDTQCLNDFGDNAEYTIRLNYRNFIKRDTKRESNNIELNKIY